ncbi:MAG: gamma-glutamylcyclotransferase family protein [Lacunisphaera sp.]
MSLIFVYGTLKRHGSNHRSLAGQQFVGEARTVFGYVLYSLGDYPGMVRSSDPAHFVTGEVWQVDPAGMAKLDQLEGTSEGLYERVGIGLETPFERLSVETYLYLRTLADRPVIGSTWAI